MNVFLPKPGNPATGVVALAIGLLLLSPVVAQLTPVPLATAPVGPVVTLSPFEVQSSADLSYGALNSNSITSFNARLDRLPISADIFTSTFMDDAAVTDVETLIATYSAGAGMGAAPGDPSGNTAPMPYDRGSAYQGVELRGLGATLTKQDGFIDPARTGIGLNTTFGLERVEVINGPQALLYGNGGAGGVINLISKQARLGRPTSGSFAFRVDQYGHKSGEFILRAGPKDLAVVVDAINQQSGGQRLFLGGALKGLYTQIAARMFGNTIVRLTGKHTTYDRFVNAGPTLTATSTAVDQRNGQQLHYLLATNQMTASATGASGAGAIGNGLINWSNVDSYAGYSHAELTKSGAAHLTAESVWTKWLSTQFSVGYQGSTDHYNAAGINFYAPNASANPLPGNWTAAPSSTTLINEEPSRTKAIRFSALLTNELLGGRVNSQTVLGADFYRSDFANIAYGYYRADADFNPIVNPAVAANNGRTLMPAPAWTVNNGPVKYPPWSSGPARFTYNGLNYALMLQNQINPALISARNPLGVSTLGGPFYLQSETLNRGVYGMNYSNWMNGKLDTLAGFRYVNAFYKLNSQAGNPLIGSASNLNFNVGADYRLLPSVRPYFSVSNSYNLPVILFSPNPTDPYGNPPGVAHAVGEEAGVKVSNASESVSGSVSLYHVNSKNEQYLITQLAVINPTGLNGIYRAPSTYIKVNRESVGMQAAFTAAPTPTWRMRLTAAFIKGTIHNDTHYDQLYNDQFYTNAQGQVTYRDGTVVFVNGNATTAATAGVVSATAPGAIPLTPALMSTAGNIYYANPTATTGQINSGSVAATVLRSVDPAHGPILTGVTGLPISAQQINPGFKPPGTIVTSVAGDSTTGYPQFSVNYTNSYTLPEGRFKGLRLGGTVSGAWRRASHYYYTAPSAPGVPRLLFNLPTLARFDAIVGYEKRFHRITYSTQVNINNLFNRYKVVIIPNATSGFGGLSNAIIDQSPRTYVWTNTFSF